MRTATSYAWECKCETPALKGYPSLEISGQVVVFCDGCGETRWVPVECVRNGKKPTLRLVKG